MYLAFARISYVTLADDAEVMWTAPQPNTIRRVWSKDPYNAAV